MRKGIIYCAILCALAIISGCKSSSSKYAAEAQKAGTEAAKRVCDNASKDDMTLEGIILDAKVAQSKYMTLNDTAAVNEFDRAFRSYIKQHNDTLAKKIF